MEKIEIKILGTGCKKCEKTVEVVNTAVIELGLDASVSKVTDIGEIISFGVMLTPAVVVNGKIKISGRIPTIDELKKWIAEENVCLGK